MTFHAYCLTFLFSCALTIRAEQLVLEMAETQQLVVGPPLSRPFEPPQKAFQSLQIISYNGEDFQDCFLMIYYMVTSVIFSY